MKMVIFDIDGVLAVTEARFATLNDGRYDQYGVEYPDWMPDWDRFHDERMDEDPVDPGWYAVASAFWRHSRVSVALLTNRLECYRSRTESWLARNRVPYSHLLMRDENHYNDAKAAHLDELLLAGWQILFGVDDDPGHRAVYESRNIPFVLAKPEYVSLFTPTSPHQQMDRRA